MSHSCWHGGVSCYLDYARNGTWRTCNVSSKGAAAGLLGWKETLLPPQWSSFTPPLTLNQC